MNMTSEKHIGHPQKDAYFSCKSYVHEVTRDREPHDGNFEFGSGSDWFILARDFVTHVIKDKSPYVQAVKTWASFTAAAPEMFFQTLTWNGPWCDRMVW